MAAAAVRRRREVDGRRPLTPSGRGADSSGGRRYDDHVRHLNLSPRGRGRREAAGEGGINGRIERARRLRRDQTDVERLLWSRLRNRQLEGWKFRRQVPVERFVVDFLCADARLVIELDGGQHTADVDAERMRMIESCGYFVIRFWNNDVLVNLDGVVLRIIEAVRANAPHPNPLPHGERE
ncbi:endonuclease domain-containing protein [Ancylobacter sp. G4_0304]|uniref:endonuclease domain-containing protein n=1 Tax=Ancylobacter sp. G4_0304 TaxID=3114289 RepID=UPI0039C615B3